ncbi:hypothetical protein MRX96_028620 [Rhipicephalus microplus]
MASRRLGGNAGQEGHSKPSRSVGGCRAGRMAPEVSTPVPAARRRRPRTRAETSAVTIAPRIQGRNPNSHHDPRDQGRQTGSHHRPRISGYRQSSAGHASSSCSALWWRRDIVIWHTCGEKHDDCSPFAVFGQFRRRRSRNHAMAR